MRWRTMNRRKRRRLEFLIYMAFWFPGMSIKEGLKNRRAELDYMRRLRSMPDEETPF